MMAAIFRLLARISVLVGIIHCDAFQVIPTYQPRPSCTKIAATASHTDDTISHRISSLICSIAVAVALPMAAMAVSGGGLDYANLDISGQDFSSGNYKGKDFTQGRSPDYA
jgi:hypothetical protein